MASIGNLSDDELCKKLKEYGISSPVTASTRVVLLKKLNNAIASTRKSEKSQEDSNPNLKNGLSSIGKKMTKRKTNFTLSNFSSDEDDESETSGPKTRLRSYRNGNDSSPIEYSRLPPKRKLAKSYDSFEDLSTYNNSSRLDETPNRNDTPILRNSPLSRGRLSRRRRSEVDKPILSNNYSSFSDSDVDDPKLKFSSKPHRDEPDNPCNYYKNFKLFDLKDDERNLPLVSKVSKNLQRGTEIRIIHNRNSPSNRILTPDEVVSHEVPNCQSVLPNGINSSDTNKDGSFEESSWSQSVSIFLLVLCVCFFLFVGLCYINIQTSLVSPFSFINSFAEVFSSKDGAIQIGSSRVQNLNRYRDAVPICSNESNKKYCLSEREYEALPNLLQALEKEIVPQLASHASLYQCGREAQHYMNMDDIALLFKPHLPSVAQESVKEGLNGFAKLASINSDFGLETIWNDEASQPIGLAVFPLPTEYLCYIFFTLYNIIYKLSAIFIAIAVGCIIYQLLRYKKRRAQEQEQKSFELVEQILEMLESSCVAEGKNFIAVNHIRDCLIPPRDRKLKNVLWNAAVKFIDEHDSRVYREIRLVGGDECQVWRWVAGAPRSTASPSSKGIPTTPTEKSWQGKAFDLMETPQHFPPVSPTACLKVRKMFDGELVFGKDWPQRVQDNLLQKCEPAKILHVAVDKESKEGCVYVKCASPDDAGVAFRALHGTWYDGNLVTVKYLREEKYHERFPASRNVDMSLKYGSSSLRIQRR